MSGRRRRRKKRSALMGWALLLLAFAAVIAFGGVGIAVWDFMHNEERQQQAAAAREEAVSATTVAEPLAPDTSAEEVLETYFERLNKKDYPRMYDLLDKESRIRVDRDRYLERHEKIYGGIRAKNITFELIKEAEPEEGTEGKTYIYTQGMDTIAGHISFDNSITVVPESGSYKISWQDSVIFPDLTETGSVRISTTPAARGRILDRNGNVLAGTGIAVSVGIVPGEAEADSVSRLAEELDIPEETIRKKMSASWVTDDTLVPIATVEKLRNEELYAEVQTDEIARKQLRDKHLSKIPGVKTEDVEVREYPYGEVTSHLVGYLQGITQEELDADTEGAYSSSSLIGKVGLESLYEERLRGTPGRLIRVLSAESNVLKVLAETEAKDGEDIVTTIDMDLQQKIYDTYLEDKTASVAMNPYTGEVLALVSTPSYDDNLFIMGISQDEWDLLNDDPSKPLVNRFRAVWTPGSSFKPVVGAIGVSTGVLDPEENLGSESSWQADAGWGNYYVTTLHAASPARLVNALVVSDNVYFAKVACMLGTDLLESTLNSLGFGERIPFDIQMGTSTYAGGGHIESDVQLADSGYGQGSIQVNPLHLATIYSAFLNSGSMIRPHLEHDEDAETVEQNANKDLADADEDDMFSDEEDDDEDDDDGDEEDESYVDPWPELAEESSETSENIATEEDFWRLRVFSPHACELINEALTKAVESSGGTGHGARVRGLTIAGKTGTAEIKDSKDDMFGTELGWFAAYTPELPPEEALLLVTMVEDVKERGGSGYVTERNGELFRYYCLEKDEDEE
ncbi:MAG: hypothetical protein J6N77_03175 [Lachnospiraceae bacterium]|nr:hypothetical protein [Lachnospiraceae bacterium]